LLLLRAIFLRCLSTTFPRGQPLGAGGGGPSRLFDRLFPVTPLLGAFPPPSPLLRYSFSPCEQSPFFNRALQSVYTTSRPEVLSFSLMAGSLPSLCGFSGPSVLPWERRGVKATIVRRQLRLPPFPSLLGRPAPLFSRALMPFRTRRETEG